MMIVMVNASKDEIRVILRDIKVHATSMKDRPVRKAENYSFAYVCF